MAKPKVPADGWEKLRLMWENDPLMTFTDVGKLSRVTPQAVGKRAKKEGWVKSGNPVAIKQRAHRLADTVSATPQEAIPPEAAGRMTPQEALVEAVEEDCVKKRADILSRHRSEWNAARKRVYESLNASDFQKAKLAKITSEAMKIIQDGERKAWGLDDAEPVVPEIVRR